MGLKTSLVAYWKLDEASGDAVDAHGSSTLTETSGTIASATGKISTARDFEAGDTEYFEAADSAALSTGDIDFTFSLWFWAETLTNFPVLLRKGIAGVGNREYALFYDTTLSRLRWEVVSSASSQTQTNWGSALSTGTWYHALVWHDSVNNQAGIVVNNTSPVTNTHNGGVRDGAGTFQLGASSDQTLYWDGLIDEVGFWKRLLTAQEKAALYNGGSGLSYDAFEGFDQPPGFEVRQGPPMRGSPWLFLLPQAPVNNAAPPPPTGGLSNHAPEVSFGPPVLGAPWATRFFARTGDRFTPPPAPTPTPPTPSSPGRGKAKPFIPRVPDVRDTRRLSRATEKVHDLLNSLIGKAQIAQVGNADWVIRGGAFEAERPPDADDDVLDGVNVGTVWVDTDADQGYMCMDNSEGAAVWRQITS